MGICQTIKIPIGIEENVTGNDSYVPYHRLKSPKIALALSGGGARGLAQIGVLKVFEHHGLPIRGITGTSMGAVIGGLYAMGYTADDLDSLARNIAWDEIIRNAPLRQQLFLAEKAERARHLFQIRYQGFSLDIQSAFTNGIQFNQLLSELTWKAPYPISRNFDQLAVPFRAVSTDLLTGQKVVFSNGSLIEALRASMAIPLLFTPVKDESYWLVDGGLVQNLPVQEARELHCDIVIAIDTSAKLRNRGHLQAPWEVADQVTTIMAQDLIEMQYRLADVGIRPQLQDLANTDFSKADLIIRQGELAAEEMIPKIDSLMVQYQLHQNSTTVYTIHDIQIEGCDHQTPDKCLAALNLDLGQPVPEDAIRHAAQNLYRTGHFTMIDANLDTLNHRLIFTVQETPWIEKIEIMGNRQFSDSVLLSKIKLQSASQIQIRQSREDIKNLLKTYHYEGFTLARLRSNYVHERTLHLDIDEGRIDDIRIKGNKITKAFVIRREITLQSNELFNIKKVNESVQNIYSTGYFEDVRFRIYPHEEGYHLVFEVAEHQYSLARLGLKFDLEHRTKGFFELVHDNIFGIGAEGSLTGLLGPMNRSIKSSLRADRLYTSYLTSMFEIGYDWSQFHSYMNYQQQGDYEIERFYSVAGAGSQMQRLGTLSVELRSEGYQIHADTSLAVQPGKYFIQTICVRSEVDTRDRMPFPRHGKYHRLEYETSARFLGSDADFIRLSSTMESFNTINKRWVFRPKFFWGTSGLGTPFPKQYRMGGLKSFMGLPEDALIGKRSLIISTELLYYFPVKRTECSLSVRYDFGGTWEKYAKISEEDFKHGIGAIISVNTLLGPFTFAAGRMSDGRHQFYLSLGHDF